MRHSSIALAIWIVGGSLGCKIAAAEDVQFYTHAEAASFADMPISSLPPGTIVDLSHSKRQPVIGGKDTVSSEFAGISVGVAKWACMITSDNPPSESLLIKKFTVTGAGSKLDDGYVIPIRGDKGTALYLKCLYHGAFHKVDYGDFSRNVESDDGVINFAKMKEATLKALPPGGNSQTTSQKESVKSRKPASDH